MAAGMLAAVWAASGGCASGDVGGAKRGILVARLTDYLATYQMDTFEERMIWRRCRIASGGQDGRRSSSRRGGWRLRCGATRA